MERFRITLDDETHLIGAPEPGVLTVMVDAVVRTDSETGNLVRGCTLSLGGMDSTAYTSLDSIRYRLEPGARIGIEVLPDGPFDRPSDPQPMPVPPWAAEDRAKQERAKDEHEPIREAAEYLGWTVIENPTAADLASAAPSAPPDAPLPAPAIDTSSTRGMERFRVTLRGQTHLIGLPEPAVLSVFLCAVVRSNPGDGPKRECTLELGGLHAEVSARWANYDLVAGDKIEIEVLPPGSFDKPASQSTEAQREAEYAHYQRDYVRTSAKKLGWAVIEGPTPALSS